MKPESALRTVLEWNAEIRRRNSGRIERTTAVRVNDLHIAGYQSEPNLDRVFHPSAPSVLHRVDE